MGQLIIVPQGAAGEKGISIGEDVIAYYPFEETADLGTVLDNKNNFNGETARLERVAGYLLNGLPVIKTGTKNFEVDKVLDEIPSTKKFSVEFWFNPSERIGVGEHRTYTIFSKQWTSGMKLFAYFVSRLESLQLHIAYEYIDITGTTRQESTYVTIPSGYVLPDTWHRFVVQLDLRDGTDTTGEAWYSKYGVYYDSLYAVADTDYFVNVPQNFALTPVIIGGDTANLKLAANDSTIDIIVDGLPFASSARYGLEGILDEVIIRRNLVEALHGTTERPRLTITVLGDGIATKDPDQESYLAGDEVEVEGYAAAGYAFRRWRLADGTVAEVPIGSVSAAAYDAGTGKTTVNIKEDLIGTVIPVIAAEGDYYIRFTSGTLSDKIYLIQATTAGTVHPITGLGEDTIVLLGDLSGDLSEDDTFIVGKFIDGEDATVDSTAYDGVNDETAIDIKEDLIPGTLAEFSSGSIYYIKFTAGALNGQFFRLKETVAGVTPALDQLIVAGDASPAVDTDTFTIYTERSEILVTEDLIPDYIPLYDTASEEFDIFFTAGTLDKTRLEIYEVSGTHTFLVTGNLEDLAADDTFRIETTDNPTTIKLPVSRTIYLDLGGVWTLTVNIVGDGTVTIDPDQEDYGAGTVVTLTAAAGSGYYFAGWSGDLTGATNPGTVTMDGDKTITATFKEKVDVIYISHNDLDEGSDSDTDTPDDIYISHDEP